MQTEGEEIQTALPEFAPRRIASLQPSLTLTIAQLGALDRLVACTRYCADIVPELRSSTTAIVHDSWSADCSEILATQPDLVVASIPYRLESLAEIMKAGISVAAFAPHSLSDIYRDTQYLSGLLHVPNIGAELIHRMQSEIAAVGTRAGEATTRPRVYCEEWGKPLIHSSPWVSELVALAGGDFVGVPGRQTTAEAAAALAPDIILVAWCGAGDRVPLERLIAQRGWADLPAVRSSRVFCINDELLNTPAYTLVGGLRAIACAIHPEIFGDTAPGLRRIRSR